MTTTPSLPLSTEQLDRLEALARAATPGPWAYQEDSDAYTHIIRPVASPGWIIASATQTSKPEGEANGRWIAAANPATILSLIAQARTAQQATASRGEPVVDAEFLSKRLARVAKLVGAHIPEHFTHEQVAEVAGTVLGEIARLLEARASHGAQAPDDIEAWHKRLKGHGYYPTSTGVAWGTAAAIMARDAEIADLRAAIANRASSAKAEPTLPRALGVSRDAESPGFKGVLVSFSRPLNDGELRALHNLLNGHASPAATPASDTRAAVPDGCALVPKTITEDMHAAAVRIINRATGNSDWPPMVWAAMLAAAPTAAIAETDAKDAPHPEHRNLAGLNQFISLYCNGDSQLIACAEAAWYRCMSLTQQAQNSAKGDEDAN